MKPEIFKFSKAVGRFITYVDTEGLETPIPPGHAKAVEAREYIEQLGKRKKPANPGRP